MKVLDTSFLIEYGKGNPDVKDYLLNHSDERFVLPAPAYIEYLLGGAYATSSTVKKAHQEIAWVHVSSVTKETSELAAEIADELPPEAPYLDAVDAMVAAQAKSTGAAVVAVDGDLTHEATQTVIDVDELNSP
jgi:predicted nucleic acid-binding protein